MNMLSKVETLTPPQTPTPIGPYSHIAKVGQFITIGGVAGVDQTTGELAGPDVYAQTKQILQSFKVMLASVGSDLDHVIHVNVFLKDMQDFEEMNAAYVEIMGELRPARTAIAVQELPKPGALLTMNLTAVSDKDEDDPNGFEQLKMLMTYTTFHIGLYTTLSAAVVGFLGLFPGRAGLIQWQLFCTLGFLVAAGICGGLIASRIPHTRHRHIETFSNLEQLGPGEWGLIPAWLCIRLEHLFFWLAVGFALYGLSVVVRQPPPALDILAKVLTVEIVGGHAL
jgi:2-iminobutanoate/2-iminopropanoate deaminase